MAEMRADSMDTDDPEVLETIVDYDVSRLERKLYPTLP